MGKIIPMRRRTYRNEAPQAPGYPGHGGSPAAPEGDPGFPTPAPQRSQWLKVLLTVAGTAVVSVIAVDIYRKIKGPTKNPDDDDLGGGGAPSMNYSAAVPGAPQIMPMPMPIPMPMPMPMPNFGMPMAVPAPTPMTGQERIELARLEVEKSKNEAAIEKLRMWEDGEVD